MKGAWIYLALGGTASVAAIAPLGCGSSSSPPVVVPLATAQDVRDASKCMSCHPSHYGDWAKSMHAYASKDPVFVAMNKRGQRETNGALGTFCVNCHAPMAVRDKLTTDGLNLDSLPDAEKGVTCYFCHNIDSVGASHANADLNLANDLTMRGEIPDPVPNAFHASTYSSLQDDTQQTDSAQMCGTCHDIVTPPLPTTPGGGHIERTFSEWSTSVFSPGSSCAANGNCHMASTTTPVAIAKGGKDTRKFHSHDFPAVDVAYDPTFPATPADQQASIAVAMQSAIQGALCVTGLNSIRVFLDAAGPGHDFPSGAAQDRRVWVEVVAEKNGQPIYSSGSIPAGQPVGDDPTDKDLWVLRDRMFDANDQKVDMFWQAACGAGNELQQISNAIPAPNTHQVRAYPNATPVGNSTLGQTPDKVTLKVHVQPIGVDVLDDLVASGDLDPAVVSQVATTIDVPIPSPTDPTTTSLVWTPATAMGGFPDLLLGAGGGGIQMSCVSTLIFNITGGTFLGADPPAGCPGMPLPDAGTPATVPDAGAPDSGRLDAGAPDAGASGVGTL